MNPNLANIKFVRTLMFLMFGFNLVSYIWVLVTGRYNGDYISEISTLGIPILSFLFIISCIPFYIIYEIYKYFKRFPSKRHVPLSLKSFRNSFLGLFIWNLFITLTFGVGKMMSDVYQAPLIFTAIIVITNRIDLITMALILIFYDGSKKNCIFYAICVCGLGIIRNSLSAFMKMGFGLLGKFYNPIMHYLRKHKIIGIGLLLFSCLGISLLFEIRDSLRNPDTIQSDMSIWNFLAGKLSGRFSSYSNLCMIIQHYDYFNNASQSLNVFYPCEQILASVFGNSFQPNVFPEKIMVEYFNKSSNVSFMCGVPGALIIAFSKSIISGLLVLFILLFMVLFTFKLIRLLPIKGVNEIAAILTMWYAVGGSVAGVTGTTFSIIMIILYVNIWQYISQLFYKVTYLK